jgi:hypothetical protein
MKVIVVNSKHAACLNNSDLVGLSVRYNLALYNDTHREICKKVAKKLDTGSIALTKAIADITSQLEPYRLKQLDKQKRIRQD